MDNPLYEANEAKRQQQIDAGRKALEARVGQPGVWIQQVRLRVGETVDVPVIVAGVRYGKLAWLIVRDGDGREYRVRPHNVLPLTEARRWYPTAADAAAKMAEAAIRAQREGEA